MPTGSWGVDRFDTLVVGDPNAGSLIISDVVPPELIAFYSANYLGEVADFIIQMFPNTPDPTTYSYEIVLTGSTVGPFRARGWVVSGVVHETAIDYFDGIQEVEQWGFITPIELQMTEAKILLGAGSMSDNYPEQAFNGVSLSRGVADAEMTTALASVTTVAGNELNLPFLAHTGVATAPTRIYEFFANIRVQQTVATDSFRLLWRFGTALTGTQLCLFDFCAGTTNTINQLAQVAYRESTIHQNDFSAFISIQRQAGTGTATVTERVAGGIGQFASYSKMTDVSAGVGQPNSRWFLT